MWWGGLSNSSCHDPIIIQADSSPSLASSYSVFFPDKVLSLWNLNFSSIDILSNLTRERYYNSWMSQISILLTMAGKHTYFRLGLQRIFSILQRIFSSIFNYISIYNTVLVSWQVLCGCVDVCACVHIVRNPYPIPRAFPFTACCW